MHDFAMRESFHCTSAHESDFEGWADMDVAKTPEAAIAARIMDRFLMVGDPPCRACNSGRGIEPAAPHE
jgi:hypothetical protein